jgi:hypothetical protein
MKSNWNSFKIKEQRKHPSLNILDVNQAVIPSIINSHPTFKSKVSNTFSFPDVKMYNEGQVYKYNGDRSETSFEDLVSNVFSKSKRSETSPKPSEKPSKSSEKPSKSSEKPSKPSKKPSKSSEKPSKPSKKSPKSSEKPSKSSGKSTKASGKSTKASGKK